MVNFCEVSILMFLDIKNSPNDATHHDVKRTLKRYAIAFFFIHVLFFFRDSTGASQSKVHIVGLLPELRSKSRLFAISSKKVRRTSGIWRPNFSRIQQVHLFEFS